jgi:hypothetical protein
MRSRTGATIAACVALLFAVMALSVRQHWWNPGPDGAIVIIPLLGLGAIDVNIWAQEPSTAVPEGWLPIEVERRFAVPVPLSIDIWLRRTTRDVHLLRMRVPAWPLVTLSAIAGSVAVSLWPRQRIGPR